jgi:hypothetical protein
MTTGRTVNKWIRVYADGYDLSGYSREIGPLLWSFDESELTCFSDAVKGVLPNHATLGIGTLNGVMDNTATSGLHAVLNAPGTIRTVMIPVGIQAEPIQGDPVYMGQFEQQGYYEEGDSASYVSIPFAMPSASNTTLAYNNPWGYLLRPKTATTAVNTAVGIDDIGASTAFGGFMEYQVFAGNGTGVIRVQDAATNVDGSFADLSGCTTGVISFTAPTSGIIAIDRTATVRRYLRWQVTFTTSTSVTFALAFVRATY